MHQSYVGFSYVSYINILVAGVLYVFFINPLGASESSVSRINYPYNNLPEVGSSHVESFNLLGARPMYHMSHLLIVWGALL